MDPKEVRKALGLPEDATDDQVQSALLVKAGITVIEGGGEGGEPVAPVAPPVAVTTTTDETTTTTEEVTAPAAVAAKGFQLPPGTVLLEESTLAELRAGISRTDALIKQRDDNERESLVAAAIGDGRIPPARGEHWLNYLENDLEGGRQVLAAMQPGIIPVHERGHARTTEGGEVHQAEAEIVSDWTAVLFPEVRAMRASDAAAAAGTFVRQRITADGKYARRGA